MISDRHFLALLKVLSQSLFFEEQVSISSLISQIFSESKLPVDAQMAFVTKTRKLLNMAAKEHLTPSVLENRLAQQSFSESQKAVIVHFWKTERSKIHAALVRNSSWNSSLEQLNWRIDVPSDSMSKKETNEPVAIVQMVLKNQESISNIVQLEMDKSSINQMMSTLDGIQEKISKITNER